MILLDEIRYELGVSPTGNQGRVADTAAQRARELLRKKQPFLWNATNLSPMVRKKQADLFTAYHASVRIVHFETDTREQIRRNENWLDAVPAKTIIHIMETLPLPEACKAHWVEWRCV